MECRSQILASRSVKSIWPLPPLIGEVRVSLAWREAPALNRTEIIGEVRAWNHAGVIGEVRDWSRAGVIGDVRA